MVIAGLVTVMPPANCNWAPSPVLAGLPAVIVTLPVPRAWLLAINTMPPTVVPPLLVPMVVPPL